LHELVIKLPLGFGRVAAGVTRHLLALARFAYTLVILGAPFKQPIIPRAVASLIPGHVFDTSFVEIPRVAPPDNDATPI